MQCLNFNSRLLANSNVSKLEWSAFEQFTLKSVVPIRPNQLAHCAIHLRRIQFVMTKFSCSLIDIYSLSWPGVHRKSRVGWWLRLLAKWNVQGTCPWSIPNLPWLRQGSSVGPTSWGENYSTYRSLAIVQMMHNRKLHYFLCGIDVDIRQSVSVYVKWTS